MTDNRTSSRNKIRLVKALVTLLAIGSAIAWLATSSFEESMVFYKTVEEALADRARFEETPVRINGLLVPESIQQKPGTDQFKFQLKKNDAVLDVTYAGILPDTMREGKELVVEGTLLPGEDVLNATEILTKCPSKYEKEAQSRNNRN